MQGASAMTIYLYKKTHNKTGLQYLGKTIKDPYKYKGSGDHWIPHIKKHGYDVTTEILRECQTNEEVKEWGLYYSELWNVVDSKDWANMRPEEGTGGGTLFKTNNPMKDPKIAKKRCGQHHHMKDPIRRQAQSLRVSGPDSPLFTKTALEKKSGINHYMHNSSPSDNPAYDHTLYEFQNIRTGEVIKTTAYEFTVRVEAHRGNVSQLVHRRPSPKSVKGWKLV